MSNRGQDGVQYIGCRLVWFLMQLPLYSCRIGRCHRSCFHSGRRCTRATTPRQPVTSCWARSRGRKSITCSLWNDIQRSGSCSALIRYSPLARVLPWIYTQSCFSTDLMPCCLLRARHSCARVDDSVVSSRKLSQHCHFPNVRHLPKQPGIQSKSQKPFVGFYR